MNRQAEYKALLWASRRGMLELDVILTPYLTAQFEKMSEQEILHFEQFLKQDDPDLYAWLMGFEKPAPEFEDLTIKIKSYIDSQLN